VKPRKRGTYDTSRGVTVADVTLVKSCGSMELQMSRYTMSRSSRGSTSHTRFERSKSLFHRISQYVLHDCEGLEIIHSVSVKLKVLSGRSSYRAVPMQS